MVPFQEQLLLKNKFLRLVIVSTLLAMLATLFITFTVDARTMASDGVITQHIATPQFKIPNSNLKTNRQGEVIFSPDHLHCHATLPCLTIINTTGQTIDLYLNGQFIFSMPPGDEASSGFNYPGTDIFTIPNTNPNAQLIVKVNPYAPPNADLKTNKNGNVVFLPRMLICSVYDSACITITNTTNQQMDVYLNGVFYFTIYPNQVYGVGLSGPGKYIFTIPKTNPNAKLIVIGK